MTLHYQHLGQGPALVILHGLFGQSDNWLTLARNVFGKHFSVYMPDARNHGESPHSDEFSQPAMIEDLRSFLDTHGITKAHIIGHSMGGKTAMGFACKYPERVDKLIVVDIAPREYYVNQHLDIIDVMQSIDFSKMQNRNEVDEEMAKRLPEKSLRQFLLKNIYWQTKEHLAWRVNLPVIANHIEAVGDPLPTDEYFFGPTLFIRGENSNYIQGPDVEDIKLHFANAHIETIANAGHWVQAEQPQAFAEVAMRFLEGTA